MYWFFSGISVPPGVTLIVNGRNCTWVEGKCLVFDDSFLHGVEGQNAGVERVVLILDLWHPDITNFERNAICTLFP